MNFVGGNQGINQPVSQKCTSTFENKQFEDVKRLIEISDETCDDDNENSENTLNNNSFKNNTKNLYHQYSFNTSHFRISKVYRYSRYIHFQSFLI